MKQYAQTGHYPADVEDEPRTRSNVFRFQAEADNTLSRRSDGVPARASSRQSARAIRPAPVAHEDEEYIDMAPLRKRAAELAAPTGQDEQIAPSLRARKQRPQRPQRRFHPLFFIGTGTLAVILLWLGLTQLLAWGSNEYNTITYGFPRTFQMDAVVGQGDSTAHPSHFVAINLHGTVSVIQYPAGDTSRARQVAVISLIGNDQAPAILSFVDIHRDGKPILLITVGGVQTAMVNDGKTFRDPTATEQQQIQQALASQGGH